MKWQILIAVVLCLVSCNSGDGEIEKKINEKLVAANPNVRATVRDGVVTLTGTCPDPSCKNVSETAAKEVEGVERVINEVVVSPSPTK